MRPRPLGGMATTAETRGAAVLLAWEASDSVAGGSIATMELLASLHCQNAPGEMRQLADDLMELVGKSCRDTPALTRLMYHVPCRE